MSVGGFIVLALGYTLLKNNATDIRLAGCILFAVDLAMAGVISVTYLGLPEPAVFTKHLP